MKNILTLLPLITIVVVLVVAFILKKYNKQVSKSTNNITKRQMSSMPQRTTSRQKQLDYINSDEYLKAYIIDVINNGSRQFNFKGGIMEGGFASKEDAPKIACYVMSLSGRECKEPYPKDAQMFYSSICAGCHGMDGKGLGGSYPDLTRPKLLGIEKTLQSLYHHTK